jgi:uncharacterized membrane-anchored protein
MKLLIDSLILGAVEFSKRALAFLYGWRVFMNTLRVQSIARKRKEKKFGLAYQYTNSQGDWTFGTDVIFASTPEQAVEKFHQKNTWIEVRHFMNIRVVEIP